MEGAEPKALGPLPAMDAIDAAVLGEAGESDPGQRHAAFRYAREIAETGESPAGSELEDPPRTVVDKVTRHAYKVLPEEIEGLKEAGLSEDEMFELILATACGAGRGRLEVGLRGLGRAA